MAGATNQFILIKLSNKSPLQEHINTFFYSTHVRSYRKEGHLWQVEMQVFPVPWLHDVKNMMSRPLVVVALIDFLI